MLPISQLESLSNIHAEIKIKRAELSRKMMQIEFDAEIEKIAKKDIEAAENTIMEAVKKGNTNVTITTHEPSYYTDKFFVLYCSKPTEEMSLVGKKVSNELKMQGLDVTEPKYHGNFTTYNVSWLNIKPNPNYKEPDFEKTVKKLQEKVAKMNNLIKQATKIIEE